MRHVLAIFPLLGCESAPRVVEPSRSARASASSVEGSDPKDWYTCNEDADCVVVKATCGEYDAVRRASAEAASAHYQWQNAGIECVHKELPYPRARCVAQRCVAEVDPTETPRDREARRHAVGDDDAVANLRSTDVLELNYALRHVGDKPELGGSQVAEVSRLLKHETPFVRAAAANALLKLTSPDRAQAADLHVRALDSFGGFDSEPHARALAGFRDQGERIAPDIVQMLNSKSEAIPAFLVALRELGESAKGVAPSLLTLAIGGRRVVDTLEPRGTHHKALLETLCAIAPAGASTADARVSCKPPTLFVSPTANPYR